MKKNSILLIISSFVAIYAIIGFVAIPKIAKPQIEKALNENLTQNSSLEKVEFNPFLLKFTAHNLKIGEDEEPTVSIEKILVDFSVLTSIDEQHIAFKDLQLVNPFVNIIEYEDGTLNVQKLVKEKKEEVSQEENKEDSNIKFQIYRTILDDARIKFTKLQKDEDPFKLDIDKLNYTFYDMGTFRNTLASHNLRILINKNSELNIKGGLRLDPFKMYGNVELKNIRPQQFLTYKKDMMNFKISDETYLNLKVGYNVDASKELKIKLNDGQLDFNNIDIIQKDKSILSLENFAVENLNLNYPENVVSIDNIYFNKLDSKTIIDKNGVLNYANLIKEEPVSKETKTDDTKETTTPWKVQLKALNIKKTNINFQDFKNSLFVDTKNINIDLDKFNLDGSDFTLNSLNLGKPDINFKDNKNKLEVINKNLEVALNNLASKDGQLSLNTLEVKNSGVNFKDLTNLLTVDTSNINIKFNSLTTKGEDISLKNISLTTPNVSFKDSKNKLDVNSQKITATVSNIKKVKENISLGAVNVKNPTTVVNDNKNSLKINTNSLSLDTENLNLSGSDIKLAKAKLNTKSIKFNDKKSKLDVTTKNINVIATNTSLIKEKLKIAILSLTKPTVTMLDKKNNQTIVARDISLKINDISNYKDSLNISKVNLYEPNLSIKDKNAKTDIIARNIYVSVNKISNKGNKLKIVSSSINKPNLFITLGKQPAKAKDEKTVEKKVAKKTNKNKNDFKFDIGPVKIKDMKMTFEDKNLPIPFKTNITDLNGNFSRLNSSNSKPTKLLLEGKVDKYGYTKITGTVDINDIKLLTDTNLLFKNIAIKNFTPYSGKFVGRKIDSGKLDLDLKYNIKKSDLKAQNSVVIDKLKLGDKVDSPDAANLPLELAIALLEDSSGVIDLNLPVSGNVDDPQFSIAPIVWKAFFNLIMKAVTSPFSLLGAILGIEADQINSLEFEFGKSDILASEKEALDNIAKILAKKPKLAIKINPVYNPTKDKIALQDIKFEQFLIKEMKRIPEGDEYKEALEDLYDDLKGVKDLDDVEESFTKKDKDGNKVFDNEAYVESLRKTLASKQNVSEAELNKMAKQRITNIKNYLLVEKKVPNESIKIEDLKKQQKNDTKWVEFKLDVTSK